MTNSIPKKIIRIHYMDNLRAYAMLLGVFFHAALAYCLFMEEIWIVADSQNSIIFDVFSFFSHTFRMPLFFLISGYFTYFLVEKRGIKGLLRNRAKRVLLPFIIFLPLVLFSVISFANKAMIEVENQSYLLQYMKDNPASLNNGIITMHLWFLNYLIYFYILSVIFYKIIKIKVSEFKIFTSVKLFLFAIPLLLVPFLVLKPAPLPNPERLIPELGTFSFYGLFFFLGWFLFKNASFLDRIGVYWKQMLVIGLFLYLIFYLLLPEKISLEKAIELNGTAILSLKQGVYAILQAYISVYVTLALLIAGRKFLNIRNRTSRFIADSSYWLYLIHLPILFYLQFVFLDRAWNVWIKFLVASISVTSIGLITYILLVRWTPIGALLNGKRKSIKSIIYNDE